MSCSFHTGQKRIIDDLRIYSSRQIVEIRNHNELWYKLILPDGREYEAMQYIHFCPKCGEDLTK